MAMSEEMVNNTAQIVPIDFWIIRQKEIELAAAYCYKVRNDVIQLINSGDTEKGRKLGSLTFLASSLINFYQNHFFENGFSKAILDYGPTSVGGIQNEGLASFKTSFGCVMTPKITLKAVI